MTDQVTTEQVKTVLTQVTAALPGGGEDRPGQAEMALAVGRAIADRRHLVVQAGTGTGKSLAYLVPSVLAGEKVVVATATKALQDQLATKDLPLVAALTEGAFTFAVLKGRSNYLCKQRASEVGGAGDKTGQLALGPDGDTTSTSSSGSSGAELKDSGSGDDDPGRLGNQVRRLLAWAGDSSTGDRAELDFEPTPRAWAMVSTTARECPGAFRCPSGRDCFAEDARARAAEADVVVVNTHLYGAHLASGGSVLPPHDVVVFDEVHEVEEVMTDSLGIEIGPGRFRALAASARGLVDEELAGAVDAVAEVGDVLQRVLAPLAGTRIAQGQFAGIPTGDASVGEGGLEEHTGPEDRSEEPGVAEVHEEHEVQEEQMGLELGLAPLPSAPPPRVSPPRVSPSRVLPPPASLPEMPSPRVAVELATGRVSRLIAGLRRAERDAGDDEPTATRSRRDRTLLAAGHLSDDLAKVAALTSDQVAWVDGESRSPTLRVSPIEVGPLLAEVLWEEVSAVMTSATVPLQVVERLGLPPHRTDELDVGSPFDYATHAMLYVARSLPDRRRPESEPALHDELEALMTAAGGRTLALFTSWRAMSAAVEALRDRVPFPILAQSDLPKPALIEAFSSDEATCLFATLGFWQGVDVPGPSLSVVTIDRIPFPRPNDPVMQARRDRAGAGAFKAVDLPRAGTLLAQGAGRLIRSADDRGVVAVLDSRLASAGYRGALLARIPPMRRTIDRRLVEEFLQELLQP